MNTKKKQLKILSALTDDGANKFTEKIAEKNDWLFETATTADQTRSSLLNDTDFSIVLLDHQTAGENFTLIAEGKQLNPFLKPILFADKWNLRDIRGAMNKGAFDILLNPIDYAALSAALERAAEQVRQSVRARQTTKKLRSIKAELEIAARIQQDSLPSEFNAIPGCTIFASMIPAREISGDFYDFFTLGDHQTGIVIGDVSGKGIPAALFMAVCRSLLRATALQGWSPSACLSHVNKVLSTDNPSAMFVTVFYGILNIPDMLLEYCIAGHDSPFVISKDGKVRPLERTGNMALGFDGDATYQSKTVYLAGDDSLFLYTDGITEAENPARLLYGRERLIDSLTLKNGQKAEQLIKTALKKIRKFTMGTIQSDDITALAVTF